MAEHPLFFIQLCVLGDTTPSSVILPARAIARVDAIAGKGQGESLTPSVCETLDETYADHDAAQKALWPLMRSRVRLTSGEELPSFETVDEIMEKLRPVNAGHGLTHARARPARVTELSREDVLTGNWPSMNPDEPDEPDEAHGHEPVYAVPENVAVRASQAFLDALRASICPLAGGRAECRRRMAENEPDRETLLAAIRDYFVAQHLAGTAPVKTISEALAHLRKTDTALRKAAGLPPAT